MPEANLVAIVGGQADYPLRPPFDPPNPIYDAVLQLLARLDLDGEGSGRPDWNPFASLVGPGQHVVIKPNFVSSRNFHQRYGHDDFLCCCTHPSVIRPVIDLAWHKKTGVTLSLKNMIGVTNEKYWLPHFKAGAPPLGDEYPLRPPLGARLATFLSRIRLPGGHALVLRFPPVGRCEEPYIYDGSWSGNDTLWRTILDLNRIVLYADKGGLMCDAPQRRMLSIIDGIVAGEGNGPLAPSPKRCGLLVAGLDSWACDYVTTRIMGIEPLNIGFLSSAACSDPYPVTRLTPDMLRVVPLELAGLRLEFILPGGWMSARAAEPVPSASGPVRSGVE